MNFQAKADLLKAAALKESGSDPIAIAIDLMSLPEISLHGPEHHMLDGTAFLVAYHNAVGGFDLASALTELQERAALMPGATCGYWGMCGSSSSVGAALSILHGSGPLSNDQGYKDNLLFASAALAKIGAYGGPRCCKRNAFLSLSTASAFVKEHYGVNLSIAPFTCPFSSKNPTCLGKNCPFHFPTKATL